MSKTKFPKSFGKVSSKKADVFGNKFESLAHHAEDLPDLPSEWGSMERAERAIPDDLRELYESDATWDGALMVKFANSHGVIHRAGNVELMIRKYLIERIARAESTIAELKGILLKIEILAEGSELAGDKIPAVTSRTLLPLVRDARAKEASRG